jgi:N4-gp56 family major capsid protein
MAGHPVLFATNDNLTRKKWAKELYRVILPATEFGDLVGSGSNSIIEMRTDLGKGEGDTVTFGIRLPLVEGPIVGTNTVEGNEEKLRFRNFSVTIEELNKAVDTGGKMDQQRIPYNLLEEGKNGLQDWWADWLSNYVFSVLCGDASYTVGGATFAQANVAPDAGHLLRVNDVATDATMTSADLMDLTFLDRLKQKAEVPVASGTYTAADKQYKVRPLKIGGKDYYRVILHPYVFDRLRQNMNIGQWGDLLRSANKLQVPNVEFEYNGLLVSKSLRIRPSATNGNVYNNILLGCQAAVFAWGGAGESKSTTMSFVPYTADAERYVMIRGGGILGCKKVTFDSIDFGVVVGRSWGEALT